MDLRAAMAATWIPQELRAILMFDIVGVEVLEETVILGKVNMNRKDSLLTGKQVLLQSM